MVTSLEKREIGIFPIGVVMFFSLQELVLVCWWWCVVV